MTVKSGTLPLNMYQTEEQIGDERNYSLMGQVRKGKKQLKVTS